MMRDSLPISNSVHLATGELLSAASHNDVRACKRALAAGASIDGTHVAPPPLCVAALHGGLGAVKALIQAKASVGAVDEIKRTALYYAALRVGQMQTRIATCLLEAGADVNARDTIGCTPLDLALTNGNTRMASKLVAAGGVRTERSLPGWLDRMNNELARGTGEQGRE